MSEAWSKVISSGTVAARLKRFQDIQKHENDTSSTPRPARVTTNLVDVPEQGVRTGMGRRSEARFASPAGRAPRDSTEGSRGDHHPPVGGGHGPCILGDSWEGKEAFTHLPARPNTSQRDKNDSATNQGTPSNPGTGLRKHRSSSSTRDHDWQNELQEARSRLKTVEETQSGSHQNQSKSNRRDQSVFDELESMINDALGQQDQAAVGNENHKSADNSVIDKVAADEVHSGGKSTCTTPLRRHNSESHSCLSQQRKLHKRTKSAAQNEESNRGRPRSLTTDAIMARRISNVDWPDSSNIVEESRSSELPRDELKVIRSGSHQISKAVSERTAAFENFAENADPRFYSSEDIDRSSEKIKMRSLSAGKAPDGDSMPRHRTSKLWPFQWARHPQEKHAHGQGSSADALARECPVSHPGTSHGHPKSTNSRPDPYHTHHRDDRSESESQKKGNATSSNVQCEDQNPCGVGREICHNDESSVIKYSEDNGHQASLLKQHGHNQHKSGSCVGQSDNVQCPEADGPTKRLHESKDHNHHANMRDQGMENDKQQAVDHRQQLTCPSTKIEQAQNEPDGKHEHHNEERIHYGSRDNKAGHNRDENGSGTQLTSTSHVADKSQQQDIQKGETEQAETAARMAEKQIQTTEGSESNKTKNVHDNIEHRKEETAVQADGQLGKGYGREGSDHTGNSAVLQRQQGHRVLERIHKLEQVAASAVKGSTVAASRPHSTLPSRRPSRQASRDASHEMQAEGREKWPAMAQEMQVQRTDASRDGSHEDQVLRRSHSAGRSRRMQSSSMTHSIGATEVGSPVRRGRATARSFEQDGSPTVRGNSVSVRVEIGVSRSPSKRRGYLELGSVESSGRSRIEEDSAQIIVVKADIIPEEDED